jgi:hypothetical protein
MAMLWCFYVMRPVVGDGSSSQITIDFEDDVLKGGQTYSNILRPRGVPVGAEHSPISAGNDYTGDVTCTVSGYKVTASFSPPLGDGQRYDMQICLVFPSG